MHVRVCMYILDNATRLGLVSPIQELTGSSKPHLMNLRSVDSWGGRLPTRLLLLQLCRIRFCKPDTLCGWEPNFCRSCYSSRRCSCNRSCIASCCMICLSSSGGTCFRWTLLLGCCWVVRRQFRRHSTRRPHVALCRGYMCCCFCCRS